MIRFGSRAHSCPTQGLIDFAFNPAFSENNYFYISYTISDAEVGRNKEDVSVNLGFAFATSFVLPAIQ